MPQRFDRIEARGPAALASNRRRCPTPSEAASPATIAHSGATAEKPESTRVSSSPIPSAAPTPAMPPILDRNAASSRNWARTCCAARRRRSAAQSRARALRHADEHHVAMPIAPMSRLTPARPTVTSPMRALRPSKVAMIRSAVERVKSFSAVGGSFAAARRLPPLREAGLALARLRAHVEHHALRLAEAVAHGAGGQVSTLSCRFSPKNPPRRFASSPTTM